MHLRPMPDPIKNNRVTKHTVAYAVNQLVSDFRGWRQS